MAQGAINPSGAQSGSGFSAAVRAAIAAVATRFSGASAPAASGQPFAYQQWIDETTGLVKTYKSSGGVWVAEGLRDGFLGNGVCVNLKVNVLSSDLTQAVITCDAITVEGVFCAAVSETMDTNNAAGANGIDTGSWAADTWYALWLIANDDASLVAPLASLSASSPTMPSGYTRKRRIGWVRSRPTPTNLHPVRQVGPVAEYIEDQLAILSGGTATTETDVDLSPRVPPGITRAFVVTTMTSDAGLGATTARDLLLRPNGDAGASLPFARCYGPNNSQRLGDWIDTDANRVIEYKLSASGNATAGIAVRRWWDPAVS